MAVIQPRGKATNKRFQFTAPAELIDEFNQKKELLERTDLSIDMTDDFIKVIKDAIKTIDKRLAEVKETPEQTDRTGVNSQQQA